MIFLVFAGVIGGFLVIYNTASHPESPETMYKE
jgi:hypothetical protein